MTRDGYKKPKTICQPLPEKTTNQALWAKYQLFQQDRADAANLLPNLA